MTELKYTTEDREAEFVYDKLGQNIIEYIDLKTNKICQLHAHKLVEFLVKTDFIERRGYKPLEADNTLVINGRKLEVKTWAFQQ